MLLLGLIMREYSTHQILIEEAEQLRLENKLVKDKVTQIQAEIDEYQKDAYEAHLAWLSLTDIETKSLLDANKYYSNQEYKKCIQTLLPHKKINQENIFWF